MLERMASNNERNFAMNELTETKTATTKPMRGTVVATYKEFVVYDAIELPDGKTWANVKGLYVDDRAGAIHLKFDDETKAEVGAGFSPSGTRASYQVFAAYAEDEDDEDYETDYKQVLFEQD
jgi:hypothetical protein